MEKSHLLTVLRSTNQRERRQIGLWLRSPAHNQREDVVKLFDWLVENGHLDHGAVEKRAAWTAVFPGEPFDDARMRQAMHFLLKNVEEFLIWEEMTKEDVRKTSSLASVYRRRQLEKPFRQSLDHARRSASASPLRNAVHLQNGFNLELEEYKYLTTLKGNTRFNLQELSDSLDAAFVAQKLRIASLLLTHGAVYKAEYDTGLLEDVLRFVETHRLLERPAVATYFYCLKTILEKTDEANYERFEECILQFSHHFPQTEQRELFLFALNFCLSRVNAGNEKYARKIFELYRRGFEKRLLLEDGFISGRTFTNAVQSGLKLKEFDWVEHFITEFQQFLEEKQRLSVVNFNLARLHYEKGQYDAAMRGLLGFEYDDLLWNLIAKSMLMKIYYEKREMDALESHLEAMRAYLQRKEVLGYHKAIFKNLLSLTRKLVHLNPYSQPQREKLRRLIVETNPLMEREWLLRQVDEKAR